MNKAELFEATLKRFAENGDRDAALVLELAGIVPADDPDIKEGVCDRLRAAIQYCTSALTSEYDYQKIGHIKEAINNITSALQGLTKV